MSKSIKIGTLFPKHLNLNGDQANLMALKVRAEEYGWNCSIVAIHDLSSTEFDLIFLGHGSLAAWADIDNREPALLNQLAELVRKGKLVLAIGSGYAKLAKELGLSNGQVGEHRSEFVEINGVVGYLNSSEQIEAVSFLENSLMTLLHGPVLIKNPELADNLLERLGVNTSKKTEYLNELDQLAAHSRTIAFEH